MHLATPALFPAHRQSRESSLRRGQWPQGVVLTATEKLLPPARAARSWVDVFAKNINAIVNVFAQYCDCGAAAGVRHGEPGRMLAQRRHLHRQAHLDHRNNSQNLANDQRGVGFARLVNAGADIGAYELQPGDDAIFTPDSTRGTAPANSVIHCFNGFLSPRRLGASTSLVICLRRKKSSTAGGIGFLRGADLTDTHAT